VQNILPEGSKLKWMKPVTDHIQITVKDLKTAEPFYDKFLEILGFDMKYKSKGTVTEHEFDVIGYYHLMRIFAVNSPGSVFKNDVIHRRKPGALHHLVFKAGSCEEVDEFYIKIKQTGAHIVDPPNFYPQHGEHYDALFFKDPGGIKYEIVYEECKPK
jgi:catechol 2,3-dioxygenase-like lactoylglutathione lyase family enzyme